MDDLGVPQGDITGYLRTNPKKTDAWYPRVEWFGGYHHDLSETSRCTKMTKHMASSCGNLLYHCIFWRLPKNMAGSEMSDLWWFCAKVRGWGCGRNHETIQFWLLLNIGYRSLEYIGIIILGKHEHEQTCFTRVFVLTPVHMHHCNTSSSYIWHGISTTSGAIHQLTFLQWVRPLALSVRSV